MKTAHLNPSPVRFDEEQHRYFLGDKELQGVTSTLLRLAFPDKYKDIDPDVLANAARKGKDLHAAIEFHDNFNTEASESDDERVEAYERIKLENGLTTIANEYLVSDLENYASSIDLVMQDSDGLIALADIKTTWQLDKAAAALQLSIYKRMFEQQNPELCVSTIYVIWLPNKDHSIAELHQLAIVDDQTIDNLITAHQTGQPYTYSPLPDEWAQLEQQYLRLNAQQQAIDQQITDLKKRMMEVMQQCNISTVRTTNATVSYIGPKTTQRFDSATFRKENQELYNNYMRPAETAAQIRVTIQKPF